MFSSFQLTMITFDTFDTIVTFVTIVNTFGNTIFIIITINLTEISTTTTTIHR